MAKMKSCSPMSTNSEQAGKVDKPEESCGAASVESSMSEDTRLTAITACDSGEALLPDHEWSALSNESRAKLRKWFELAVERLQLILDQAEPAPAHPREVLIVGGGHMAEKMAKALHDTQAASQTLNPHGWTDQPNYRYPCCLGSPQEGHKPHCKATSQPVEDPQEIIEKILFRRALEHRLEGCTLATAQEIAAALKKSGAALSSVEDLPKECTRDPNTCEMGFCDFPNCLSASSVEDSAPTARERTLLIDRIAIDAELIRLRAELARAKDALREGQEVLLSSDPTVFRDWVARVRGLLSEARK